MESGYFYVTIAILAMLLALFFFRYMAALRRIQKNDSELQTLRTEAQSEIERLEAERLRLARWATVADADAKAQEIRVAAVRGYEKAKSAALQLVEQARVQAANSLEAARTEVQTLQAEALEAQANAAHEASVKLTDATNDAKAIENSARAAAKKLAAEAELKLESAMLAASKIVEEANIRAREIAGSAVEARNNAAQYERAAKALKNIIEGYGNEYLLPAHSFLDDIAEDFAHTDAGRELKSARERTRALIKSGFAATCDYVEATRRETAIEFVVDAFNGKVDSILSRIKHDNAGKLSQEIRDAFELVNLNGKAFREARINEEYLSARLNELKWGVVSEQLRIEERDEQRRIKERIRE